MQKLFVVNEEFAIVQCGKKKVTSIQLRISFLTAELNCQME